MDEFSLIERLLAARPPAAQSLPVDAGDDGAVLPVDARHPVHVMDTLIEGVHFPCDTDPVAIGHKALAVNLSDLAAMGASPAFALLSLTLPQASADWIDGFARGFHSLARRYGVRLIGGDTTRADRLMVSVMLTGFLPTNAPITRHGSRPGDALLVTGTLGDGAAGLALVQRNLEATTAHRAFLQAALERPEPPVSLGALLGGQVRAGLDLSDGLWADVGHLLSDGLGVDIRAESLPTSEALLATVPDARARCQMQLTGGDDYQLLLSCAPEQLAEVQRLAASESVRLTEIGRITDSGRRVVTLEGTELEPRGNGYRHF